MPAGRQRSQGGTKGVDQGEIGGLALEHVDRIAVARLEDG